MTETRQPRFSIVLPVYNGAEFVDPAISSVLAQTFEDWELWVIDDGSTDGSVKRARRWAEDDPRIRTLQHPGGVNRGVSATRNLGMANARGQYIALLDGDDVWLPTKLERQNTVLQEHPDLVLTYAKAQLINAAGELASKTGPGFRRPEVFGRGPSSPVHDFAGYLKLTHWIPASSAVFPRLVAAECGDFDESLRGFQVEDSLLFGLLSERGPILFVDEVLVQYRVHGNQWNNAMSPGRKQQGRLICFMAFNRKVSAENRPITTEALIGRFDALACAIISPWEIRPFLLTASWMRLLADRHVPVSIKARTFLILLRQLALLPIKTVQRVKYAMAHG